MTSCCEGPSAFRCSAISVLSANWAASTTYARESSARSWSNGWMLPEACGRIARPRSVRMARHYASITPMRSCRREKPMAGAHQVANMRGARISLAQIDAAVAAHLGPRRVAGNERGPCFSQQVSMYLAKNFAGWSTVKNWQGLQRPTPHDRSSRHRQDRPAAKRGRVG